MLRLLLVHTSELQKALIQKLRLDPLPDTGSIAVSKKWSWILWYKNIPFSREEIALAMETYQAEHIYICALGYSVDMIHEIGDVIVPNVFLSYNPAIETQVVDRSNQDILWESARFLTFFEEQKDYYVEEYGLSLWGIIVDKSPKNPHEEIQTKLMQVYEADAYVQEDLSEGVAVAMEDAWGVLMLVGVSQGKNHQKYRNNQDVFLLLAEHFTNTISLLEQSSVTYPTTSLS